jgi:hypothetical protein
MRSGSNTPLHVRRLGKRGRIGPLTNVRKLKHPGLQDETSGGDHASVLSIRAGRVSDC